MSNTTNPVPRLDLAPKLKRPLSLWNPLDYLRLLYWVFFFPQALRWYVETFGNKFVPEGEISLPKIREWFRQNPAEPQFLFQGLILTVVMPLIFAVVFPLIGIPSDNLLIASCELLSLGWGLAFIGAWGVASNLWGSLALGMGWISIWVFFRIVIFGSGWHPALLNGFLFWQIGVLSIFLGVGLTVKSGVQPVLGLALSLIVVFNVFYVSTQLVAIVLGNKTRAILSVTSRATFHWDVGITPAYNLAVVAIQALGLSLILGLVLGLLMTLFTILRFDIWITGLFIGWLPPRQFVTEIYHLTLLPLPSVYSKLNYWLRNDWEAGIYNIDQLLTYTLQFIPVIQVLNRSLEQTPPEQIIFRTAQVSESPYDWRLVRYLSASLSKEIQEAFISILLYFIPRFRSQIKSRFLTDPRLDTNARATAAGFWYWHEKEPEKSVTAFAVVRSLLYGEEMFALAQTLAACHTIKEFNQIANLEICNPSQEALLRPTTWKAINSLRRVVEDARLVQRSVSRAAKSLALNRTLGEIKNILNNEEQLPQAERDLIIDIAQAWQEALLQVVGEVGEVSITKPVSNPYVTGDPVEGNLFIGREEIIRQLEELWVLSENLQSVLLFGHRRMGKTSILKNIAHSLGSELTLAYVNLLEVGDAPQGVGEVLMAICDVISAATDIGPPRDEDLLNLPYPTLKRYLRQVETQLEGKGLIIALDEFERIEELIEAGKIHSDFMGVLRGWVQASPKIAFAFAGLHTLEEMNEDYFHPFFKSYISIAVGFLSRGATRQLLANPNDDFLLDYDPEALDQIYDLTSGQPYLVQLVGFQLVRRYNDLVFQSGRPREPVFSLEDVEAVITDPEFFRRGRYYFTGVWGQAAQGAEGQQVVLQVLASHPQGLSLEALVAETKLDPESLEAAIACLERHDVIKRTDDQCRIIVELFRRWVVQR